MKMLSLALTLKFYHNILIFTMLELAHVLTGGVIAYSLKNPALSLPLAFASHFALDLLPHWNPHLSREKKKYGRISFKTTLFVIADCLTGLALGLFLAFKTLPDTNRMIYVILGCFFGALPDFLEAPYYFLNIKSQVIKKLVSFQSGHQSNVPVFQGLFIQAVYVYLLLWLV